MNKHKKPPTAIDSPFKSNFCYSLSTFWYIQTQMAQAYGAGTWGLTCNPKRTWSRAIPARNWRSWPPHYRKLRRKLPFRWWFLDFLNGPWCNSKSPICCAPCQPGAFRGKCSTHTQAQGLISSATNLESLRLTMILTYVNTSIIITKYPTFILCILRIMIIIM